MRDKMKSIENLELFPDLDLTEKTKSKGKSVERLSRLDLHGELKGKILPLCRLKYGEIWEDPIRGHKVGVADAATAEDVRKVYKMGAQAVLVGEAIMREHDIGKKVRELSQATG